MAITPRQEAIAAELDRLSDGKLKLSRVKEYITLDYQLGESKLNKNAISVLKRCTTFMISDWSLENETKALGLRVGRDEDKKTLQLFDLDKNQITTNEFFFKKLLQMARDEAHARQTK